MNLSPLPRYDTGAVRTNGRATIFRETATLGSFGSYVAALAVGAMTTSTPANASSSKSYSVASIKDDLGQQLMQEVEARCAELEELAEDEDLPFNAASMAILRGFVRTSATIMPAVVLTDGGHLRAIWRSGDNEQAALIFRSVGEIQFVFFAEANGVVSRASGVAPLSKIAGLLVSHGVSKLVRG